MRKLIANLSAIAICLMFTSSAYAGEWVKGYGDSIKEAIETAKDLAEFRISQRGGGCVDGKTRNLKKEKISGEKVWTIEIFTNNHNGSCDIDANANWIKKQAESLAKAYVSN